MNVYIYSSRRRNSSNPYYTIVSGPLPYPIFLFIDLFFCKHLELQI